MHRTMEQRVSATSYASPHILASPESTATLKPMACNPALHSPVRRDVKALMSGRIEAATAQDPPPKHACTG
jgi:hypothetical protein